MGKAREDEKKQEVENHVSLESHVICVVESL